MGDGVGTGKGDWVIGAKLTLLTVVLAYLVIIFGAYLEVVRGICE